jgi:short-subunit dehydrogenase
MSGFAGQRIIITGASVGIGRGVALALARQGAKLALGARNQAALESVVTECRALGGEAIAVPTDVTDAQACRRLIEATVDKLGGIDGLVNNAGISMWARFEEVQDLSIFEQLMRVNYLGAVYCTHYALPHLKASRGLLVAISSMTGFNGVPTRSGYAASKQAMQGFFDSLRIELAGTGVEVLVVLPGFVATDVRAHAFGGDGKPLGESPRDEAHDMSVEECARLIVSAMAKRRRELVMMKTPRIARLIKLFAPSVMDRLVARAIREK